jgi:hypothetical protein
MIRTQVSLDEEECVRAVRQMLPARGNAPWMRYAGFVESGDARSSNSVDNLVYGSKD